MLNPRPSRRMPNNMAIADASSAFTGAVANCKIVRAPHAGSTFTNRRLGEFLRDRRFGSRGADRVAVRSDCVDYRVDQTKHWSRGGGLRHSDSNAFLLRAPAVCDHHRPAAPPFERGLGSLSL